MQLTSHFRHGCFDILPRPGSALAQLVEQLTVNQRVAGSSPAGGANKIKGLSRSCVIA